MVFFNLLFWAQRQILQQMRWEVCLSRSNGLLRLIILIFITFWLFSTLIENKEGIIPGMTPKYTLPLTPLFCITFVFGHMAFPSLRFCFNCLSNQRSGNQVPISGTALAYSDWFTNSDFWLVGHWRVKKGWNCYCPDLYLELRYNLYFVAIVPRLKIEEFENIKTSAVNCVNMRKWNWEKSGE